jgi:hypothetical protein
MGFDISSFTKPAARSIAQRATGEASSVLNKVLDKVPGGKLGQQLLGAGTSVEAIRSMASIGLGESVKQLAGDFFSSLSLGTSKKSVARTAKTLGQMVNQINPETKIDNKEMDQATLQFPTDIGKYFVSLVFSDYERPAPMVASKQTNKKTIFLPIPRELVDQHNVRYNTMDMGLVGSIVDATQIATSNGPGSTAGQQVGVSVAAERGAASGAAQMAAQNAWQAGSKSAMGLSRLASLTAAASLSQSVQAGVEQLAGAAINPNPSVAFAGPSLRQFAMTWQFSPNSPDESRFLKQIIKQIRKRTLPSMTFKGSTGILSYPQVCEVSFEPNQLIKHKKAMISGVTVNYAANGIPAYFKGTNEPVFIELQLFFEEIEFFLSEDFGGESLYRDEGGRGASGDFVEIGKALFKQSATVGKNAIQDARNITGQ